MKFKVFIPCKLFPLVAILNLLVKAVNFFSLINAFQSWQTIEKSEQHNKYTVKKALTNVNTLYVRYSIHCYLRQNTKYCKLRIVKLCRNQGRKTQSTTHRGNNCSNCFSESYLYIPK